MTIRELNYMRDRADINEHVQNITTALNDISRAGNEVREALHKLAKQNSAPVSEACERNFQAITSQVYNIANALKYIRAQNDQYRSLLDDICRTTEIDWPPRCGNQKEGAV